MLADIMNVREVLVGAAKQISARDAEVLLRQALGKERSWLLAHPEAPVEPRDEAAFVSMTERRAAGEPLQYILGEQEFYGLSLRITPAVLIPRPETELLVESVLAWAGRQNGPLRIVDVGTGSGAIALALAAHLPEADITATDISSQAIAVARANALRLGLDGRLGFVEGDLLARSGNGKFLDCVVSNPPYIALGDAVAMQREVVEHEPHLGLFAGEDGLAVYRRLIPESRGALRQGGLLAMEIGFGQEDAIHRLLAAWKDVNILRDYAGLPRVCLAERP